MADDVERALTDDERGVQLLVAFKRDLQRLALSADYGERGYVVIVGLLEVAEGLIRRSLHADPAPLPVLLSLLDGMRARVEASVPPSGPPVMPIN